MDDLIERIKFYIRERPDIVKRAVIVFLVAGIGIPSAWWFVRSAEEKAYILFTNGYYQYRNRMYEQSASSLGQLVSLYPNSKFTPMGRYYLSLTHLSQNNLDGALRELQLFMDENPGHFLRERIFAMRMALELNAGRTEACVSLADQFFSEFGKETPSTPEVLYRKGVALTVLGKMDDASECFKEAAVTKESNIFGTFAFYAQTAHPGM